MAVIQHQIKLGPSVAFDVVFQGIRIRLGRSIVTLLGVVFGIAFFMAMMSMQAIRAGVARESLLRTELQRMKNFLTAEIGPLKDRRLGVIQAGPLNVQEQRFLGLLLTDGLKSYRYATVAGEAPVLAAGAVEAAGLDDVGVDCAALLVVGEGEVPSVNWQQLTRQTRQAVVALSRNTYRIELPAAAEIALVALERQPPPDELQRIEDEARTSAFRTLWIVVISLLVTVIGISNAMLMSVTERFREIGTMKCLGALSSFIRQIFFIESSLIGLTGAAVGSILGAVFALVGYSASYGPALVLASTNYLALAGYFGISIVAGVVLSVAAAIYPASFASRMVPATALRSNI